MNEHDDIDGLAAEYVLGTLDASERASVAARRPREAALNRAIVDWERRLAPLNTAIRDVAPPAGTFAKIEQRLSKTGPKLGSSATVTDLTRRLKIWRTTALAASALAASLILTLGALQYMPKPKTKNLVAVLQKDATSPAFLVSVNVDDRVMTVRPIAAKHEAGKSFELWIIHDSLGQPKSLGVIDEAQPTKGATLASYKTDVIEGSTYAVTLEPEGGSPSGAPTGPVVFAGKMIEATDF
ncbi:MAG: anti-sigma factor [Hyphomicrobium sp.]